jgi:hypothetical protein
MIRVLVPVEDIDVSLEQGSTDTWMQIICYDGSGDWNTENTMRLIVWRDAEDDDEYPRQHGEWYPRGTLIPLDIRR